MFKNYLLIALRNLLNNRLYSAINILGLAVGLGTCLMLILFIIDENRYDQFWTDSDNIYRISSSIASPGNDPWTNGDVSGKAKQTLLNYFSEEISVATRFAQEYPIITVGEDVYEEPIYLTDPETADIFDFEVLKGELKQTLTDNRSIALSEELAIKYYGNTDVIGKVLTIAQSNSKHDYRVGAVYSKLPRNTVLSFNALIKLNEDDFTEQPWMFNNWLASRTTTYFKLKPTGNIENINQHLVSFVTDNVAVPDYWADQYSIATEFFSLTTIPIKDIYLNYPNKKSNLIIFAAIAVLILVIACINFTNLSIARSTRRAREVAMRKVVGASQKQLIIQFLAETIFIALIALVVGVALAELLMPAYNKFLGRDLLIAYSDGYTLAVMLGLVLFAGGIGGIYPAFILSSFRPADILKSNKSTRASGSATLSNILVIFQFVVSISLIICAVVIYAQRDHASKIELGYDKDHIVILHGVGRETLVPRQKAIQQQIKALPGIISASYIELFPSTGAQRTSELTVIDGDNLTKHNASFKFIDSEYQQTFDAKLLSGRMFDLSYGQDVPPSPEQFDNNPGPFEINVLINELAVKQFGFGDEPNDAIGKTFQLEWPMIVNATIVGVIANTNYRTIRDPLTPEFYLFDVNGAGFLAVHFKGSPIAAEKILKNYWQENITDVPFVRTLVSETVEAQFVEEQRMSVMLAVASSLAVMVACMGLFGLASLTAERRTKEIGLRKVMGADVSDIVKLLVWQFSKPIVVGSLIGSIGSFWAMSLWLEQFPYRIDSWFIIPICLAASLLAIAIAWLTVGGNAIKVARAKPIKALRYE